MSYELLLSLYFGEGSNADLTTPQARRVLHVSTPLEARLSSAINGGLDVVVTGNPGDGKSHVARTLAERGLIGDAALLLDLSARSTTEALNQWAALKGQRRFLMCANEGPLRELVSEASFDGRLSSIARELEGQLGHLTVADANRLPNEPKSVMLVDLADRNVLDITVVGDAVARICREEFLPELRDRSIDSSAGRNMLLLQNADARLRLARILIVAGQRRGEHVTFRQLWAAIALAVTGGKGLSALQAELSATDSSLGLTPLDHLTHKRARGLLAEAVRLYADVAGVSSPDVDDALWHTATLPSGDWYVERPHVDDTPQRLWDQGATQAALHTFRCLKRAVALGHTDGERLVNALEQQTASPSAVTASELRQRVVLGLRRLYVSAAEEPTAPEWVTRGVPLWVNYSFQDRPTSERPHVAVSAVPVAELEARHPCRAPWLDAALGPKPDLAWLHHIPSGEQLVITPEVLSTLDRAAVTAGPMEVPASVERFLARVAGWAEREFVDDSLGEDDVAILERPRGGLLACPRVRVRSGGASYA